MPQYTVFKRSHVGTQTSLPRRCTMGVNVVDNALACHLYGPVSNQGLGMWQGSGRPSRFGFSSFLHQFDYITPTSAPSRMPI